MTQAQVLSELTAGCQKDLRRGGMAVFFEEVTFGGSYIIKAHAVGKLNLFQGILQ